MTNLTDRELTPRDMRRLALTAQGLLRPAFGRGTKAALKTIRRLGYLQIDTISVVERAHHHALASRVPGYHPRMLDELQQSRQVFEYWSHAAAYMPMEDYRFYLPMMQGYAATREIDRKLANRIKAQIRAEGPMQSRDFEAPAGHRSGGWWDWKPAKVVLDQLFLRGELMISRRENFQKVYDLTERVLPGNIDNRHPTPAEWGDYYARQYARALGVATRTDIAYARATIKRFGAGDIMPHIEAALPRQIEAGKITKVLFRGEQYYADTELMAQLPRRVSRNAVQFLSPFDNIIINRPRLNALFDFAYQIECYVPAPKRQYGYFCLPILWGDEMIGRMDAKADRKSGLLQVHGIFLEAGVTVDERLIDAMAEGLRAFARANQCNASRITRTLPATLKAPLVALLTS